MVRHGRTLGLLALLATVGCDGFIRSTPVPSSTGGVGPEQLCAEYDRAGEAAFSRGAEARAWLAAANHETFEVAKADVTRLVNDLYALGASEIRITDIEPFGSVEVSAALVAVLPEAPEARAELFRREAEFYRESLGEDVGQRYLRIAFD